MPGSMSKEQDGCSLKVFHMLESCMPSALRTRLPSSTLRDLRPQHLGWIVNVSPLNMESLHWS